MSRGMYADEIKALARPTARPKKLLEPDRRVSVDNPLCGDRIDLDVSLQGGKIAALAQEVRGCMLCRASANVLAESAIGLSRQEVERVSAGLTAMLKSDDSARWPLTGWESLALFEPVSRHKSRHGCVTLPFKALLEALS